ncbi:MAG: hypothetical protein ACRBBN_11590 [Methyloligellaceae bacterium]
MEKGKDYFDIWFNSEEWPFWNLDGPYQGAEKIHPTVFSCAKPFDLEGRLVVKVYQEGPKISFNFTGFGMVVVSKWLCDKIGNFAGVDELQLIPVEVEGNDEEWEILNPLLELDCIDEARSVFRRCHDKPRKGEAPENMRVLVSL